MILLKQFKNLKKKTVMLPNKTYISEGFNDLNINSIGLIANREPRFKDDTEYVRVDVDYSKYLDNIKKVFNNL